MMSQSSKDELMAELRLRYRQAPRNEKQQILDDVVAATGYHRKYAIQVLNHPPKRRKRKKRTSQTKYQGPVRAALEQIWRTANCICGERLAPVLPECIEALERFGEFTLDDATREQLLTISPATMDRLLKQARKRTKPDGLGTAKPGTLLNHTIPKRTFAQWEDVQPGYVESDLVVHCGEITQDKYIQNLEMEDVPTHWVELATLVNRGQATVTAAIAAAQTSLPWLLVGLDSDNGSELVNVNLKHFCKQSQHTLTGCRPYQSSEIRT